MSEQTRRTTIYLDVELYRALRLKAASTSRPVSELVKEAVKEAIAEDAGDIMAFEVRDREPMISYEEMLKRLRKDGRI
jgi:predicted DNA-binding protein